MTPTQPTPTHPSAEHGPCYLLLRWSQSPSVCQVTCEVVDTQLKSLMVPQHLSDTRLIITIQPVSSSVVVENPHTYALYLTIVFFPLRRRI